MRRLIVTLSILFMVSACAVGNSYDYATPVPELEAKTDKTVALGTLDSRSYVVSGDKAGDFVGLQRGKWNVPYDVTTASGNPLADDMTASVSQGLHTQGIEVKSVTIDPAAGRPEALKLLTESQTDRLLLITLNEWKTDGLLDKKIIYQVTVEVLDKAGKVLGVTLGENDLPLGRGDTSGIQLSLDEIYSGLVGDAYRTIIGSLLNEDEIIKALK